jgi:hypothetical protein
LGGVVRLAVSAATMYLSYTKLKQPQIGLDWAALVFSGLTTGIIAFFIVWGHFQKDPEPRPPE